MPQPPKLNLSRDAPIDDGVVEEVTKAYYPGVLAAETSARNRAQAGYTIASAVAAAIVAAGALGGVGKEPALVQVCGMVALALWLWSAGAYLYAVAAPVKDLETGDAPDAHTFVRQVLRNAKKTRDTIDEWGESARTTTIAAIVATALTLLLALLLETSSDTKPVRLVLTRTGIEHASAACGRPLRSLTGKADPGQLDDAVVPVELAQGVCGSAKGTLRLPRADVAASVAR